MRDVAGPEKEARARIEEMTGQLCAKVQFVEASKLDNCEWLTISCAGSIREPATRLRLAAQMSALWAQGKRVAWLSLESEGSFTRAQFAVVLDSVMIRGQ